MFKGVSNQYFNYVFYIDFLHSLKVIGYFVFY